MHGYAGRRSTEAVRHGVDYFEDANLDGAP
jgi:hypothetical protein